MLWKWALVHTARSKKPEVNILASTSAWSWTQNPAVPYRADGKNPTKAPWTARCELIRVFSVDQGAGSKVPDSLITFFSKSSPCLDIQVIAIKSGIW